jgi:dolichol-phosphate mannosyltransferase
LGTPRAVSIVIPLFNERDGVAQLGARLLPFLASWRATRDLELILVDDGSVDGTAQALAPLAAEDWIRIRRHETNRGLTEALRTGLDASSGAVVCWLDSDLSYDPSVLIELVDRIDGGADVAISSPHHPEGRMEGVSLFRRFMSRGLSRAYRLLVDREIHTFTGMVRAYRREVLVSCWPERGGFLGVTEVLLRALAEGVPVAEVPAVMHGRKSGSSKLPVLPTVARHVSLLVRASLGLLRRNAKGQSTGRAGR